MPNTCPCGTGRALSDCCGPLLDGTREAATAVDLVRARYSGFRLGRGSYLWRTLHSEHESRLSGDQASYERSVQASAGRMYQGLAILDSLSGDDDAVAQVLFWAKVRSGKLDRSFVERASFAREAGQWRYILGDTRAAHALSRAPEAMTLAHWDCCAG